MEYLTETVVLGAGPGGYVAAIRAAQLGQKVTIIEDQFIGGVCLNVGCIPSKALIHAGHTYQDSLNADFLGVSHRETSLDFHQTQRWKEQEVVKPLTQGVEALLKKNNVTILRGHARFLDQYHLSVESSTEMKTVKFQQAIIATGSRPIEISGFPFKGGVVDSTGGLNLSKLPESMLVIGGGYIGCELASAYCNLGVKVTLVEGSKSILPNFETDIQKIITNSFKNRGVKIYTDVQASQAKESEDHVEVTIDGVGGQQELVAEVVMVTVGRRPNTEELGLDAIGLKTDDKGLLPVDEQYRTSLSNIFAIGDVITGPALAHKASYDAKITAEVISGKNVVRDYRAIPAICFTDPEVATVGMTLQQAKEQGMNADKAVFPFAANGRSLSKKATTGFVRLVFDKESQLLLGAQIVGHEASELIAELTLAIETDLTIEDIALTIHAHPTLSEVIMDASEVGLGLPIHI